MVEREKDTWGAERVKAEMKYSKEGGESIKTVDRLWVERVTGENELSVYNKVGGEKS